MRMQRYAYTNIIVRILFSVSVASQVDEAFYFDSITPWHHIYVQDSVDSAEGCRDCQPCPVRAIVAFSLSTCGVKCFLHKTLAT